MTRNAKLSDEAERDLLEAYKKVIDAITYIGESNQSDIHSFLYALLVTFKGILYNQEAQIIFHKADWTLK